MLSRDMKAHKMLMFSRLSLDPFSIHLAIANVTDSWFNCAHNRYTRTPDASER
jgi:hypothetical protein